MVVGKLATGEKKRGRPRKKRKGRPPGAAARQQQQPPTPPPAGAGAGAGAGAASRRSLRQRRPRRVEDFAEYDDYDYDGNYYDELPAEEGGEEEEEEEDVVVDDEEEEDMEWKRREKKFKLLQKLPNHDTHHSPASAAEVCDRIGNRGGSAGAASSSCSSEDGLGPKPLGKRKARGGDDDERGDGVDLRLDGSGGGNLEMEDERRHAAPKCSGSASGRTDHQGPISTPLRDKKMLQAILDKLQKKDIYGVFAEPVDPEELPDYHDIIEHPMDFGTIRKKLSTGVYANLEQFESDIFLVCTNAMEYNSPDTIYFRQARSIQELARKKFQSIRFDRDNALKSEQNTQPNSVTEKPIKSSMCKASQDPDGSHLLSAATLDSNGDACTGLNAAQAGASEQPVIVEEFIDGSLPCENKPEKGEESSAKSSPVKLGMKPITLDEDRRTTYSVLNEQPDIESDSLFATFENEEKHLVAVGLDADYSYARSLARFAGSLGPIAWRIASGKIEKALPKGVKFGPGWVGEYEPLPTPVLFVESRSQQQSDNHVDTLLKGEHWRDRLKDEKGTRSAATETIHLYPRVSSDSSSMGSFDAKANYLKERPVCTEPLSQNPHLFGFNSGSQPTVSNTVSLQHSMSSAKDYSNIKVGASGKTMQQNSSCLVGSVDSAGRWPDHCPEVATSDLHEAISGNKSNLQSERFKKSGIGAHCPENASSCMEARGMSNRNDVESLGRRSRPHPSLGFIPTNQTRAGSDCFNPVVHAQVIDDPVEFMQLRSGQIPNKIITSKSLVINNQKQVMPTVSSPRSNSSAAAAAAARAWMSVGKSLEHKSIEASNLFRRQVGAAYLGNLTSEYLASTSRICEDDKKRPGASMSQTPSQPVADESCVQNKGLTAFPHFIMAELSRFHGQSSWRGLVPHVQLKQKKDMQPPDLNISFHSPGSPIRQSGILVDSQQPDLALQL